MGNMIFEDKHITQLGTSTWATFPIASTAGGSHKLHNNNWSISLPASCAPSLHQPPGNRAFSSFLCWTAWEQLRLTALKIVIPPFAFSISSFPMWPWSAEGLSPPHPSKYSVLWKEGPFAHQTQNLKTQTSEIITSKNLLVCLKVKPSILIKSLLLPLISTSPEKYSISWLLWNILTDNTEAREIRNFSHPGLLKSFSLRKILEYHYNLIIVTHTFQAEMSQIFKKKSKYAVKKRQFLELIFFFRNVTRKSKTEIAKSIRIPNPIY